MKDELEYEIQLEIYAATVQIALSAEFNRQVRENGWSRTQAIQYAASLAKALFNQVIGPERTCPGR